ncbi:MAG: AAA family ATPase [Terriglobia bacterium]
MNTIRVITVDREFGSGGAVIATKLAEHLGWKLWDELLTEELARRLDCSKFLVAKREERPDPLYYRLLKSYMRGSFEGSHNPPRMRMVDSDCIMATSEGLVKEIADQGNCVLVGRGSAYFLYGRADAFHVFIYAPLREKVRRLIDTGETENQARHLAETVDHERAAFIKKYFNKDWPNPHLYHLMVNSKIGDEAVTETILAGVATLEKNLVHA